MIHFYKTKEEWGFCDTEETIRAAETPKEAASLGRNTPMVRTDWDSVRLMHMYGVVRAKFEQHPDIRDKLIASGNQELAEHTDVDKFWADGGDGSGENWLGKILMMVRDDLRYACR